jgi:4-hydroxy-3-methylbut-2-enyl diphosphate reductase
VTVNIDKSSGFCWGVIRTIEIAEQELEKHSDLYSLGEIIHNPMEMKRLEEKGLKTSSITQLERLRGKTVIVRAHGEPPSTFEKAKELGIKIIDATCPVVNKVQERIRKFYQDGFQIVIFGKKDHAEIIGLVGQTDSTAIVISSADEINKVPLEKKTVLFSQTTMDKKTFRIIADELKKRIQELIVESFENSAIEFHAKDTICGQVSGRDRKIREFANSNDIVIFVAGRYSSNGKVLFNLVKEENSNSYFIEDVSELQPEWFNGIDRVGITGATSTPLWLMQKVKKVIEEEFSIRV